MAAKKTVGDLIIRAHELREESRKLNKLSEEIDKARKEVEAELIAAMDEQGVKQSSGGVATATISEQIVPNVTDWPKFYAFIRKHQAFYLLERRAATKAYQETLENRKQKAIPGVESFLKRSISLRNKDG